MRVSGHSLFDHCCAVQGCAKSFCFPQSGKLLSRLVNWTRSLAGAIRRARRVQTKGAGQVLSSVVADARLENCEII